MIYLQSCLHVEGLLNIAMSEFSSHKIPMVFRCILNLEHFAGFMGLALLHIMVNCLFSIYQCKKTSSVIVNGSKDKMIADKTDKMVRTKWYGL